MSGPSPARAAAAAVVRLAVVAAALWVVATLVQRGTRDAPVTLFDAVTSTNGYYAATHVVPVAAALLGGAALAGLLGGGFALPRALPALAVLLPLAAWALATVHPVDAFDARRELLIALAWTAAYFALVHAFASPWEGRADRGAATDAGAAPRGPGAPAGPWPRRAARRRAAAGRPRPMRQAGSPGLARGLRWLTLAAFAAGGLRLALSALAQYRSGKPTPVNWTGAAVAAVIPVRVHATFANPNIYASACVLFAATGAALTLLPLRSRAARALALVLGLGAVAGSTVALALTFSRAGYLALGAACVGTGILLWRQRPPGTRGRAWPALAAVVIPFAAVAAAVPGVVFRIHAIGVATGGDVQSRFFSWLDALRVWRAHPLLGSGPEGIQALYAPFYPLGRFGTYVLINVPGGIDQDLLQWLAEAGIVGGAALAAGAVLWALAGWRRLWRPVPVRAAVVAPLLAALAGLVGQSLLESTFFMLPLQAMLVVLAALWTAEAGLVRRVRLRPLPRGAAAAGAAVAAALLAFGLYRPWPADAAFLRGWALLQRDGASAPALRQLAAAAHAAPGASRDWAALADAYVLAAYHAGAGTAAQAADVRRARPALARALALNPYDAATWDVAAVWAQLRPRGGLAASCAEQWAVRDNMYDANFVLRLARDLDVLAHTGGAALPGGPLARAALRDTGYAARLLPLVLAVDREHRFVNAEPAVQQAFEASLATWQASTPAPPPTLPALPLGQARCAAALAAVGLPWPEAVRLPGLPPGARG